MPILTLQQSMRRLGRIRMGARAEKGRPVKLETWRLTSPSADLLEAAADIYAGDIREWTGSPSGRQFELLTEADTLDVLVPPGDMAFSQWFELWSGGGCQRRCDGQQEHLSGEPCLCPADPEARMAEAQQGRACKPTTRLFVVQPHLPDVGLWHFESHGFYAATELPGTIAVINAARQSGALLPARLRIEERSAKRDGKTSRFAVPVLELPALTPHMLTTGEMERPLERPARASLPAAEAPAAPEPPRPSAPEPAAAVAPPETPPAGTDEPVVPLPTAGGGDGAAFRRSILAAAKRANLDGEALEAVCIAQTGLPFARIVLPVDANAVLAALNG